MVTFLLYSPFSFSFQGVICPQTCHTESPRGGWSFDSPPPTHTPQKLGLQLLRDRPCAGLLQAVTLLNMSFEADVRSV